MHCRRSFAHGPHDVTTGTVNFRCRGRRRLRSSASLQVAAIRALLR